MTKGAAKGGKPPRRGARPHAPVAKKKTRKDASPARRAEASAPPLPPVFRLGAIAGATPGKWIDAWHDRAPRTRLELTPLELRDQDRALRDGEVDAALVRLPIERDGLHVIPLYDEIPVVVTSADSHLTAADELDIDDLAGEVRIVPADDVLAFEIPGTVAPAFAAPETTADAIATVAAGVGIVIVPMSLARLHQRRDAASRPLRGAPTSTVALAWVAERSSPAVDLFVGIVRGRTANSSR